MRDALLSFLRISLEYRRKDLHDAEGRIIGEWEEQEGDEWGRRWLVGDGDQEEGLAVDWRGRYWQCERKREKEGWYRHEERGLQCLYERGVQKLTELFDRKFSQLLQRAFSTKGGKTGQPTPHTPLSHFPASACSHPSLSFSPLCWLSGRGV